MKLNYPERRCLAAKDRFAAISAYYDSLFFPLEALDLFSRQLVLGEFLGPDCICALLAVGEQVDGRSLLLSQMTTRAKYLVGESDSPTMLNSLSDALDFVKGNVAKNDGRHQRDRVKSSVHQMQSTSDADLFRANGKSENSNDFFSGDSSSTVTASSRNIRQL